LPRTPNLPLFPTFSEITHTCEISSLVLIFIPYWCLVLTRCPACPGGLGSKSAMQGKVSGRMASSQPVSHKHLTQIECSSSEGSTPSPESSGPFSLNSRLHLCTHWVSCYFLSCADIHFVPRSCKLPQ
jgi:hypothetical protein